MQFNRAYRPAIALLGFALLALLSPAPAAAQFSGARGGVSELGSGDSTARSDDTLRMLSPEVAQSYITVDGQVELRVPPTEIRIVLALTAEAKTPAECELQVAAQLKALTAAWQQAGIPPAKIVEDFIAILPRYEFVPERINGQDVALEKKAGYLMQSNVHLAVKDDPQARLALRIAFEHNVADIIAFDYGSRELDQLKQQARAAAVKKARDKADLLLGALFNPPPAVINVQEQTRVHYPESLYVSFENSHNESYQNSYHTRNVPAIRTFRPKNTYYRGLYLNADAQAKELPMRAEISVVSTVRLYFASPAAQPAKQPPQP